MKSERIFCEYILEIHTMPTHLNSVKGVSTMFQRSCVLQFCRCMDLIAATCEQEDLFFTDGSCRGAHAPKN